MFHYYIEALSKYFTFSGRSRRKEYWSFMAVNFIFGLVIGFLDALTGVTALGYIAVGYQLLILIPTVFSICIPFSRSNISLSGFLEI